MADDDLNIDAGLEPATAKPRRTNYDDLIEKHARRTGLDAELVRAVVGQESGGNPRALSPKGAQGIGQLMPATARRFGVRNSYDPDENLRGATDYLKFLSNRYQGNRDLVLAGYNAGEGAVDKYHGVPPYKETQNYVKQIGQRLGRRQQPSPIDLSAGLDLDSGLEPTGQVPPTSAPPPQQPASTPRRASRPQPVPLDVVAALKGVAADVDKRVRAIPKPRPTSILDLPATMSIGGRQVGTQEPETGPQVSAPEPLAAGLTRRRRTPVFSTTVSQENGDRAAEQGLTDSRIERRKQIEAEVTAEPTGLPSRLVQKEVDRRLATEEAEQAKATREEPALQALTERYRSMIRDAAKTGVGPTQWAQEVLAKGESGLIDYASAAVRGLSPVTAITAQLLGRRTSDADKIALHAKALQRAAQAEGADRNAVSTAIQDVVGGTIASAPDMAMMSMGAPAPAAFGIGGAAKAFGRGESVPKIAQAGGHGLMTGLAFEVPGLAGIKNPLAKAGTIGAGTTAVDLAGGASLPEALKGGATNAAIALTGAHEKADVDYSRGGVRTGRANKMVAPEIEAALRRGAEKAGISETAVNAAVQPEPVNEPLLAQPKPTTVGVNLPTQQEPRRWIHTDFGEVVESPNQKRLGKGRVRVTDAAGTDHVIRRASLTGAGNQRAIPLRDTPEARADRIFDGTPMPEGDLQQAENELNLSAGLEGAPAKVDIHSESPTVEPQTFYAAGETSHPSRGGVQYVADDPKVADMFAEGGEFGRKGAKVQSYKGDIKVYEGNDPSIIGEKNQKYVEDGHVNFDAFERDPAIRERLKAAGYDAIRIAEGGGKTSIAVLPESKSKLSTIEPQVPKPEGVAAQGAANDPAASDAQLQPSSGAGVPPMDQRATEAGTAPVVDTAPRVVGDAVEPPSSTTSARATQMASDRAALDLPELPPTERRSWQQSLAEAQPERAATLADEVLVRPRPLNDTETASLVVRAQQVKNRHAEVMREIGAATDAEVIAQKRAEVESLEREFDRLTAATKKSGTEKGRTLAAQKLTINQDFDLISMKNRVKAAKGDNLTPAENTRIEDLHKRLTAAEAERDAANERAAEAELQKQVNRISRQRVRAETKQTLDDEFAQLSQQFRAKMTGIHPVGIDPTLIPVIGKMARNRVKAGITDAAQLVDDIHAAVSAHLPDVTKRDVRDAISGYGVEGQGDKRSVAAKQLADVRTELKNLSQAEDVQAGKRLTRQDAARQKQLEKQEAELVRRMAARDFDKPPRQAPQYTRETYAKEKRIRELKAEYEKMRYSATRGVSGKLIDTAVGVGNVPKTLLSMGDLSALLRQGGVGVIQHPVLSSRAGVDMLRSFTEHGFANVENAIKSSPEFDSAIRSGVEFTGLDQDNPKLNHREEGYLGSSVIDTAARGRGNPLKAVKAVKDFSERTFVSFLDSQRMRIFEQQSQALRDMGLKGKDLDTALKSQAKYINIITGRGSLGTEGNKLAPALNLAMFSPRLVASRFQLLNKMFNPAAWARMPAGARRLQMVDNVKFLAGAAAALGLARAAGAQVNTDPDDADFLKIKVGNTRFDTLAGLQQPLRFAIRMAKAVKGGETYSGDTKGDIFADFMRSKASPEVGLAADYLAGSNRLSGQRVGLKEIGKSFVPIPAQGYGGSVLPLPVQDFRDAIKQDGALRGSIEAIPSLLGVGVQSYKGAAEKPTTPAEKLARRFIQRKLPDEARDQQQIDSDQAKAELRARSRRGEDVSADLKGLSGSLTDKQVKAILDAKNKTRLQEDVNRLGPREFALVYSVATLPQKEELRPLIARKEKLIEMKPEAERQQLRDLFKRYGIGDALPLRPDRPVRTSRPARASANP